MRAVADAAEIPQTRENLQRLAQVFREAYGEDFWERLMVKRCRSSKADIMIVDGAREKGDIGVLMTDETAFMVFLHVDKATRKARMTARGENEGEAEMTDAEFEAAENHPNELAIAEMVEWVRDTYPDKILTIDNGGAWERTAETLDRLLAMLTDGE